MESGRGKELALLVVEVLLNLSDVGGEHGGGSHSGGVPPNSPVPGARLSVSQGHGNRGNGNSPPGGQNAYPGLKGRRTPGHAGYPAVQNAPRTGGQKNLDMSYGPGSATVAPACTIGASVVPGPGMVPSGCAGNAPSVLVMPCMMKPVLGFEQTKLRAVSVRPTLAICPCGIVLYHPVHAKLQSS